MSLYCSVFCLLFFVIAIDRNYINCPLMEGIPLIRTPSAIVKVSTIIKNLILEHHLHYSLLAVLCTHNYHLLSFSSQALQSRITLAYHRTCKYAIVYFVVVHRSVCLYVHMYICMYVCI